MNGRIEGWRELERITGGLEEHMIRRMIGLYGFPKPVKEPVFRCGHDGRYRKVMTNIWFAPAVLIWMNDYKMTTNHTIKQKGDGYGQGKCNSDRCEPRGARTESTRVGG